MPQLRDWLTTLQPQPGPGQQAVDVLSLVVFMVLGGILALLVRMLYRRFGSTISNRDTFSSLFPLLTVCVVAVIYVVKSSLALSLGLVGALSIVRFRAAIKEPEELIYLFFCIVLGVALGAEQWIVALVAMGSFAAFVLLRHALKRPGGRQDLLLTLTGQAATLAPQNGRHVLAALPDLVGPHELQRLEQDGALVQLRIVLAPRHQEDLHGLIGRIQQHYPGVEVSFANLHHIF